MQAFTNVEREGNKVGESIYDVMGMGLLLGKYKRGEKAAEKVFLLWPANEL